MRLFPEAHSRESCPGFLFLMLEASVHWSIEAEIFSAEHSLGLSCEQVFTFWFSNLILLFFWSDYQVPWWFIFPTLLCFDFSELISVFTSMSTSLSGFQHLHKPYPILLLSECWHLASAYFYDFVFLLVQFLVHSLSWLANIWLVPVVSKKLENSAFFLGSTATCFATIANFPWFHFLPHKLCLNLL